MSAREQTVDVRGSLPQSNRLKSASSSNANITDRSNNIDAGLDSLVSRLVRLEGKLTEPRAEKDEYPEGPSAALGRSADEPVKHIVFALQSAEERLNGAHEILGRIEERV